MRTAAWEYVVRFYGGEMRSYLQEKEAEEVTFLGEFSVRMPILLTCFTTYAKEVSWVSDFSLFACRKGSSSKGFFYL